MEQQEQEASPFNPEENLEQQEEPQGGPEPVQEPQESQEPQEPSEADAPEPAGEPAAPPPLDAEPAAATPAGPVQGDAPDDGSGEFTDKVIVCAQCGAEFVHTASAQAFYKEKGFANEPKRCAPCRKSRKSQGGYSSRGGGGGGGGTREMFPATCADCGKETQVPFKPSGARPVYCLDCYRKQSGG